ncbi:MFS transporter [Exophiala viscosa]|uniref:MFS transporter n=1 Tax=Exophiala viscosa TaxID=2486360 RepID=A0AAN6DWQ0_9EURO|nr:MFS transporter [Exophiala viscosa]
MGRTYTLLCASLIWGYDSGIISTTLAQKTFLPYFGNPSADMIGAIVSTYSGGTGIGNILGGWLADYVGRKKTIWVAAIFALIGGILQTAAINIVMFLVGRIIAGFAIGLVFAVSSIYNAEISPPKIRGVVVGMQAQLICIGFAFANWVGCFAAYNKSDAAWRVPLSLQILFAAVLILGLFWLPESPRWLIQKARYEDAHIVLQKLHSDEAEPDFYKREFDQIKQQINYEREVTIKSWWALFTKPSYRHRLLLGIGVQVLVQATGANALNYYQTILFESVGIEGHAVLWVSVGYGMMGVIANTACLMYIDKVGRRVALILSASAQAVVMTLIMVFFKYFANGTSKNKVGQGFAIAWIYCLSISFSLGYTTLQILYMTEIFPTALRARGTAICAFMGTAMGVLFSQVSPKAIASLGWKYFSVFLACDVVAALTYYFFYPETRGKTLEEMAELFGEEVAFTDHISSVTTKENGDKSMETTARAQQVEVELSEA